MSTTSRKQLRELKRLLEADGIAILSADRGRKHRKLRVSDGTREATVTVASTPSDWRALLNNLCIARRALRGAP
jgi:hypothetical protein